MATSKEPATRGKKAAPISAPERSRPVNDNEESARGDHAGLLDHNYLDNQQYQKLDELLNRNVATAVAMYLKFKKCHWDVRGRFFHQLHEMYDEMAEKVFASIDPLAERLVQLGGSPVAAPEVIGKLAAAQVPIETIHDARQQLQELIEDHDRICKSLRDDSETADECQDPATSDLLNKVIQDFDFNRWMLRATLDDVKID
ncbi:MAG TPA: DNA starvation/stationary phase protection protein [Deinococcales bacterium]|nr:DNA starvation/stationary phase protection protein [Deinococcales bacterium]